MRVCVASSELARRRPNDPVDRTSRPCTYHVHMAQPMSACRVACVPASRILPKTDSEIRGEKKIGWIFFFAFFTCVSEVRSVAAPGLLMRQNAG